MSNEKAKFLSVFNEPAPKEIWRMGKENEIDQLFGSRVRSLRRNAGLTQEQLAEIVGKTSDTVSNIERGFSAPRLSTAKALADALGVELAELFQFTPSPPGKRAHKEAVEKIAALLVDKDEKTLGHMISLITTAVEIAKSNKSGSTSPTITESTA